MDSIIVFLDGLFIPLYRITGNALTDFFAGTFLLALMSVAVGEVSVLILRRVNRKHMERLDREMSEKHSLSLLAKQKGDDDAYRHMNREANDAFGRVFFNMFTFSAASLWFVFFVLAWMQFRFIGIEFPIPVQLPLFGSSVGYVFVFFLLYVLSRMLFKVLKRTVAKQLSE
jgi:hypothetical protein